MQSSILDAVTLNKQIVLMRYDVRRSKVHLINKLSRQAKLLKNKKGTEEQVQKNQYKAERLVKQISVINQLDEDDVSKFALSTSTEELQEIQNDTKLLLATHAMAKLALYKFVADSVEAFRIKHPDWQKLLPSLFEKSNKSKKKKTVKCKPIINNSVSAVSGKENLDDSNISESLNVSQFNKGYESDNENTPKKRNNDKERISCLKKIKKDDASEDETTDRQNVKIKSENVNKEDTESENKRSDKTQAIDPFFLTTENTEYITTQVPTFVESENIKNSFQNRKYGSSNIRLQDKNISKENIKTFKSKNNSFNQYYKHDNIPLNYQSSQHVSNSKVHSDGTVCSKNSVHQSSEHKTFKEEKLHPSWEAKKKLSSVATFEGKKIKFDDD